MFLPAQQMEYVRLPYITPECSAGRTLGYGVNAPLLPNWLSGMVLLPHVSWSAMHIPLSSSISTPLPGVLKQLSKPIG